MRRIQKAGHDAFSCDILPTRGNSDWHYKKDIYFALHRDKWDLIILHPPCTYMALSGNRWYGENMPYHHCRLNAISWTKDVWEEATLICDRVALENPASVIFKHLNAPIQYIQPWQFGHGETKKTGLALHNLPPLVPTNVVAGREQRIWKMSPGPNRERDRSETYQGIADAIVEQWGNL